MVEAQPPLVCAPRFTRRSSLDVIHGDRLERPPQLASTRLHTLELHRFLI